jgi:mannose-6-phosphate isomerase
MLYPLKFRPIFKERVWGGRNLERLFQKQLPPEIPIGESWEISDRPGDVSEIENGPLAGKTLRWLMETQREALLGTAKAEGDRFPLLIKILDAQEKLSIQVHPPAKIAAELGGEPKTEMWYIADATPEADLYVGLRRGVTREQFEKAIQDGTVADCVHRIQVRAGDVMFLPSGRLHAIGAGNVIFEIQQNSDTTYRVFDWNRKGTDGKPRELHVEKSLASINFEDFEPGLITSKYSRNLVMKVRYVVDDPLFRVDACQVKRGQRFYLRSSAVQIVGMIRGRANLVYEEHQLALTAGEFALLPASLERVTVVADTQIEFLHIQAG